MIPASYMFKDAYRRHWEEPAPPTPVRRRWFEGFTPFAGVMTAVLTRRHRPESDYFGDHAYD